MYLYVYICIGENRKGCPKVLTVVKVFEIFSDQDFKMFSNDLVIFMQ